MRTGSFSFLAPLLRFVYFVVVRAGRRGAAEAVFRV
jgi:hypothetical protein